MRQIVLDTETTGLEHKEGHRIIEIGCVELIDRHPTGQHWHTYLNPDRIIDAGAIAVHNLTNEFLVDKPHFEDIVEDFLKFIADATLIIHNAPFDLGFLNYELKRTGKQLGKIEDKCQIIDTLSLARSRYPGQKNSLDALCQRLNVDNSRRDHHGALLDAELLVEVYLAMTGGQVSFSLGIKNKLSQKLDVSKNKMSVMIDRPRLRVISLSKEEENAHQEYLTALAKASGGICLWEKLESTHH